MTQLFGGIETGGTKFICAVGLPNGELVDRIKINTTKPVKTMKQVVNFFNEYYKQKQLQAIGIASFGPIDSNPNSPYYGSITADIKSGWGGFDIVNYMRKYFDLPIGFDTDVNGAALGEFRWGNGQGYESLLYWTVGTGIGAGGIFAGQIMKGFGHPEMGHIYVPHDKTKDPFPGICTYHKDCLEGLASGPALQKRCNVKSHIDIPQDHPFWDIEALYLAYAMIASTLMITPHRIIIGGGVMQNEHLYPKIRKAFVELLGGYIRHKLITEKIDEYIVAPALQGKQGVLGAMALGERALREQNW